MATPGTKYRDYLTSPVIEALGLSLADICLHHWANFLTVDRQARNKRILVTDKGQRLLPPRNSPPNRSRRTVIRNERSRLSALGRDLSIRSSGVTREAGSKLHSW